MTLNIHATLEDHHESYEAMVIKMEGKITMHHISIMSDLGSTHSYVTPRISKNGGFKKVNTTSLSRSS